MKKNERLRMENEGFVGSYLFVQFVSRLKDFSGCKLIGAMVVVIILVTATAISTQGPAQGLTIKVLFPSIRIELNSALMHGKFYAKPLLSPLVGYKMGEVKVWIEVKREYHTPDISKLTGITER